MLPNKPLNNFVLEDMSMRFEIPSFRVFLLDMLPKKPNKKECGIINLNKSDDPGTHWVAWYKNGKAKIYLDSYGMHSGTHWVAWYKNGKAKIYLDSYGMQPPIEVVEYLGSPIRYNTDQLQPAGQVFCGHLCLYFLKELGAGNDFQSI